MRKFILVPLFAFAASLLSLAQPGKGGNRLTSPPGKVYGKIVDDESGKPLEYAVLQVFLKTATDSVSKKIVTGALTASNGDFMMDNIPSGVDLIIRVSLIGYSEKEINFQLGYGRGMSSPEKDIGNIRLAISATLATIEIKDSLPDFRMEFDKRIYEVAKNPLNTGGTGEDVLRNIPSLQVDVDGNVNLRNTSPQIFIDGRPTTLTIDQIPADEILRVEVITNPSARFDASGGGGGIVNIVLKHSRSLGYNGNIRVGIDKRGKLNGGFDLNVREGKINFFLNANANQRKSISTGTTIRQNLGSQESTLLQSQQSINNGLMVSGKIGFDYFIDNRNTITLSQSYNRGEFNPTDYLEVQTDSFPSVSDAYSTYYRNSILSRVWQNLTPSILYKHLFAKEGTELTADANYSFISSNVDGTYENKYTDRASSFLRQTGDTKQGLFTSQVDFTGKLNDKTKLESGLRAQVRNYESTYGNFSRDNATGEMIEIAGLNINYTYSEKVYAAYSTISKDWEKWKAQFGLRFESSDYQAALKDTTLKFKISYPHSLFPSLYVTRVINGKQDIQFSLNRKINRPSFMQLNPYTDYSDSLNVSMGNPSLKPEFTYAGELSYQYVMNKQNTFIATLYGRYQTNLTVRYQTSTYSEVLDRNIIVSTYANASNSTSYGLELISRNSLTKWLDLTTNFNLYNSSIDATNIQATLTNNYTSWWAKMNASFKLPNNSSLQLIGDYSSKRALDPTGGSRGGSGGGGGAYGGGMGGPNNAVQGYLDPIYGIDVAVRKDFLKEKNLSLSLSFQDVLRTRLNNSHSVSPYFIQDVSRRRDPQFWRFNISWKFGKADSSLFRRKNTHQSDMIEG